MVFPFFQCEDILFCIWLFDPSNFIFGKPYFHNPVFFFININLFKSAFSKNQLKCQDNPKKKRLKELRTTGLQILPRLLFSE